MKQYANYHKHDHVSNIFTPDTHVRCEDYLKRIKELGYDHYFTTNHGSGGDIFEARDLCDKYGIKCHFGVEGYIVPNPLEKDNRNFHIIIIPKTDVARKKINLITSHASVDGFYYKPRIFLSDLLALDVDDVYITSACCAGIISSIEAINEITEPLVKHFGRNFFFEVQNHNVDIQKTINKLAVELARKYNCEIIAANDSHYIYQNDPEGHLDARGRLDFLAGKGINYGDEDAFILDYPDYDTFFKRFQIQGVLTDEQIEQAIDNTRIFESCEEILLDKEIKMPTAYPELSTDERVEELKRHVNKNFNQIRIKENITGDKLKEYIEGIKYEMKIVEDTKSINTEDYFLLNEKIVDLAVNKYGGVLTRTGRGSCGSFYLNKVLGMTQIDRFTSPVKLYPERFMSTARLLENRSTPDIDFNVKSQEEFVAASREVLGEHGCYPMVAYGTMQLGEAFRNVCRCHNIPFDDFNEVAKDVEAIEEGSQWYKYVEEAKHYVDVIVSASVHPCAHVLDNKDLRYEYGIVRIGEFLCVMITSGEADYWKVLKNDYLIVSVWGIISDTFKLIGKPILTVKELLESIDERVWKLYADGITCTLNQVDSDYATSLMKVYKAHSVGEMAQFTAAVRPSFDAWRDDFLNRRGYTTGSKALDEVLEETEGRITFQETLMTYFQWLGVTPAESIGLIKKISKKKIHPEDFAKLEDRLKSKWLENTGSLDGFDTTWQMVQGCMSYGFAAPHALSTAIDSLYGAWLKVNYPLEYYTTVFGYYEGDMERTKKLTDELSYFDIKLEGIKFRKSRSTYSFDRESRTIYKSVKSVKYLNADVAEQLYAMKDQEFNSFVDLLKVSPTNSRQMDVMIRLGFFSEFGKTLTLLNTVILFDKYHGKKNISKEKTDLPIEFLEQYAIKSSPKTLKFDDESMDRMLSDLVKALPEKDIPISAKLKAETEYLGYNSLTIPEAKGVYIVTDLDAKVGSPKLNLYNLATGSSGVVKISKSSYAHCPLTAGELVIGKFVQKNAVKKVDDKWVEDPTRQVIWMDAYTVVDENYIYRK